MSDRIIMDHLNASLQPRGSTDLVRIGFLDSGISNAAFYHHEFVVRALKEMEHKLVTSDPVTGPAFNPLERLAVELLMSSAYISEPSEVEKLIARYTAS